MESTLPITAIAAREYSVPQFLNIRRERRAAGFSCAVSFAVLVGCSGGSMESQVSGRVTLDGNGIGPGTVVFAPVDGSKPATGSIERSGSYTLMTSRESGLAAGKYRAAVSIREMPENVKRGDRPPLGKLLIPERYEQSTTSGLEYEVQRGRNSIDIDLTSK